MKRLVLCALIGGGIGAGVAFTRSDPTSGESEASNGMKNAAMTGEAGGALLGFVLDRRAKRKRRSALVGYADKARPKVDAAVEAAFSAAEVALPIIEARAAAARERAKETAAQAAGVAKERAAEASAAARDKAAETAIHARHAAAERADLARHKVKKSGHPKAAKALDLLPV
jgi:hypothetical protein